MSKKLFLTGKPGVGKTTAIVKFVEMNPEEVVGFYTLEERRSGKRVGFNIVTTWGERFPLASVDIEGPKVSKYGVDVEALERIIPRLEKERRGKILVIDEIGKMELLSAKFKAWVQYLLGQEQKMLATIPLRTSDPLINDIKRKFTVWEVTLENRISIPYKISDFFHNSSCYGSRYMLCINKASGVGRYTYR